MTRSIRSLVGSDVPSPIATAAKEANPCASSGLWE